MTTVYETPGVYIEEVTGPGVIQGVSTSVAAFVGPTVAGPINEPRRITTYDEFLNIFGGVDAAGQPVADLRSGDRVFFTSFAVRGFFQNGGRRAYVVNVSDAVQASMDLLNGATTPSSVARIVARQAGSAGNAIRVTVEPNTTGVAAIQATASRNTSGTATAVDGLASFPASSGHTVVPGDRLVDAASPGEPFEVARVVDDDIYFAADQADIDAIANLQSIDLTPEEVRFRVQDPASIQPGTVAHLTDGTNHEYPIVSRVDSAGFVYLASDPVRTATLPVASMVATSQTFTIVLSRGSTSETIADLSLEPSSRRYLFAPGVFAPSSVQVIVQEPAEFPMDAPDVSLPVAVANAPLTGGTPGHPNALGLDEYVRGLDALDAVDEVSLVSIPDAGTAPSDVLRRSIHAAQIAHCVRLQDRIALIDPPPGLGPAGLDGIEGIRMDVQSERGFGALYYPWLQIMDPWATAPQPPRRLSIPPSGHVAGVMARTDSQRGVFKAPANETIREIVGVERAITDRQQAPLNVAGINVLRVLPGSNAVYVWGARTTVDPIITDWLYVNVRRLMLFLEESIQEGIRWAVFEPNEPGLWKSLDRVIRAFLREQWRAGALFGTTEDQAFRVRIDEGLNAPAVRNAGRLNIEIMVAPVRPAEFVVVRIGLFDGGAEVEEG